MLQLGLFYRTLVSTQFFHAKREGTDQTYLSSILMREDQMDLALDTDHQQFRVEYEQERQDGGPNIVDETLDTGSDRITAG